MNTDLRQIMATCWDRVPSPERPAVGAQFARWSEAALGCDRAHLAALLTGLGQRAAGHGPPPSVELVSAVELRVVAIRVEELCHAARDAGDRELQAWCNMVVGVIALERQRRVKEGERLDWLLVTGDEPPEVRISWPGEA